MNDKQRIYSEWLVLRSQQGDREALHALLSLWQQRYLLYARQRLGGHEAAQDVVQESLLAICRNLHKLGNPGAFPSWSYRIIERRCADWLRRHLRDKAVFTDNAAGVEDVTAVEDHQSLHRDNTMAQIDTQRLLDGLRPDLAALLRLYYLEQLSLTEIAAILELPVGTLKSRLHYARKQIKQKLEDTP